MRTQRVSIRDNANWLESIQMAEDMFEFEKTSTGLQFVIPGTEKPKAVPKITYQFEGPQAVIPGAEQISQKRLINRLQEKPITPPVGQKSLAGSPLFGRSGGRSD